MLAALSTGGVPVRVVLAVGWYATCGMLLSYALDWGPEDLLGVPTSLGLATYVVGTAAGVRLLAGWSRILAAAALLMCLAMLPFAGVFVLLPIAVAVAALLYRRLTGPGLRSAHPG